MTTVLAGYEFSAEPRVTHTDGATGRTTKVYPASGAGHVVGTVVRSVVTAIGGGVRSSAFDADPELDYQGLKWTPPRGGKKASFCISGGEVDADCALSKLAEVHSAISEAGTAVFGAPASPFFKPAGDFVYFDLAIWNNTAICDEAAARSFGGGAKVLSKWDRQPLPSKFRLLGFLASPSHITVTTNKGEEDRPLVRIQFRAVFLAGGTREDLDAAKIPYPHLPAAAGSGSGSDGEGGEKDGAGLSHEGLTLADLCPDETLPMEDGVEAGSGSGSEKKKGPPVKRPIAKKAKASASLAAAASSAAAAE